MFNNIIKILLIITLFSYSILGVASADTSDIKTIRFAAEATYPPFASMDKTGTMQGFDVDLAKALCEEQKASCMFTHQPWDALIPSLKSGKFDAIIGGMGITAEREKHVAFTQPYHKNSGGFVGESNKPFDISPAGLSGKNVGVQGGTSYATYLKVTYGSKITIKTYPSLEDAFLDLKSGRIDLAMGDMPVLQHWIKTQGTPGYQLVGQPIDNPEFFGKGNGIVVNKSNTALVNALNQSLDKLKTKGVYQKLVQLHFGNTP